MEDQVFPRPAVAGALSNGFIEARVHVDIQSKLTEEQFAANQAVRDELVSTRGMPTFAVVDPESGEVLGWSGLVGTTGEWEAFFLEFLESNRKKAESKSE